MNPLTIGQANFNPYYNPMVTNPVIPNYQPVTAPAPSRHIDCVNGKESAYAFQLGPNSSVILVDNLAPKIWIVTTDASGYKAVKGYKIIEDDEPQPQPIIAEVQESEESKWKQSFENRIKELEERLANYEQSNNQYVDADKSVNAIAQSNDRNSQSGKRSNGNAQSDGRK